MGDMLDETVTNLLRRADFVGIQRLVAGAVVYDKDRVLLLERMASDFIPGLFELPSGKLESTEIVRDGLSREILEETGLVIESIGAFIGSFEYKSKSGLLTRQLNFGVPHPGGAVTLTEHHSFEWVEPEDIGKFNISSESADIIKKWTTSWR